MDDHVQGGRIRRFARFATVAAKTTRDLLATEAKRRVLKTDEGELDAGLQPTAARLVKVLGEMKGAATKLGQFLSLVDQDTFTPEARKVLNRLLSQTPHRLTYEQAGEMVARELGAPPEEVFAEFSGEPFAAASMGQVHAATRKDGRRVVVKIQYPGVEKSIDADIRNVALMAKGLSLAGGLLEFREYLDEIGATLKRELDYREEARQLQQFRQAIEPWSDQLAVPEVHDDLTTGRVLTLERLDGPTMLAFAEDESHSEVDRYRVGAQLAVAIWGPFLRQGLIHADPHPGNYIVLDDGRLGVLDFGATKELSVPFVIAYWHMVEAALSGDRADILNLLISAGFDMRGDADVLGPWLHELAGICERPIRNGHYDWGACRIAIDCRDLFARNVGNVLRCRAPAEGLMFYRAAAGAAGDFRMLRSKGDFSTVMQGMADRARAHLAPEVREAGRREGLFLEDA